MIDLID